MKYFSRIYLILFLLIFSNSNLIKATDLRFSIGWVQAYWENNYSDVLRFEIENANVLAASGYTVNFEIKDWNNNIVFSDAVKPEAIQPFTSLVVSSSLQFSPTLTGMYQVTGSIEFIDDIDTSNNSASTNLPVVWGLDVGVSKFQEWALRICPDKNESWGFMPQKPLESGTTIESYDDSELSITFDNWKYYGYLDCEKSARYSHLGYAFVMDAFDSSSVDTFKVNYWTNIDGSDYMAGFDERIDTADAVIGTAPNLEVEPSDNTISQSASPEQGDSVCAILVSGKGKDASEQMAFDFDVDLVKKNLMFEELGPKLPEESILVLNNPSAQELYDSIATLQGRYRKLTFYYSGHGWGAGIITSDEEFNDTPSYLDLSERMAATDIEELELIIDACHAGAAEEYFDSFRWREKDVTLIAACAADTVSYTRRLFITASGDTIRVGAYTWFLVKCYGDPAADQDGIEGVSWKEAFEWVRSRNETFGTKDINKDLMPQLYVHRAEMPTPPLNIPRDTDIEFTSEQPDTSVEYYYTMTTGFKDYATIDTNIIEFSKYRYWSYESSALEGSFNYNLKFNYNTELDSFKTGGQPGLLFRDSAGVEWETYGNYEWNENDKYIQGFDINKYGDFALGTIRIVVDVKDDTPQLFNYDLSQNYPNPFNPTTIIRYSIKEPGMVNITIFNVLGQRVETILNTFHNEGLYEIKYDASSVRRRISSGIYYYRLSSGSYTNTKKMILLK